MMAPWIDQQKLEDGADRIIPLLEGIIFLVPGGGGAVPVLQAIKMLIDNDALRPQLVQQINKATGARPPA